ncbi:MAG: hypothetical protein IPL46_29440 [Saprospiraceae bacterium]|nr:hypothetical protein [Saprospiraceae bacterium]
MMKLTPNRRKQVNLSWLILQGVTGVDGAKTNCFCFSQADFQKWAKDNVILLELDFPRRSQPPAEIQQQNAGLQRAFKVQGFPTVWVFDLDKDATSGRYQISAIGKTGYTPTVQQFTDGIDQMLTRAKQVK